MKATTAKGLKGLRGESEESKTLRIHREAMVDVK